MCVGLWYAFFNTPSIYFQVFVKAVFEQIGCLVVDHFGLESIPVIYNSLCEEVFSEIEPFVVHGSVPSQLDNRPNYSWDWSQLEC